MYISPKGMLSNVLDTVRYLDIQKYDLFLKIDDDDFYTPDYLQIINDFHLNLPENHSSYHKGSGPHLHKENGHPFTSTCIGHSVLGAGLNFSKKVMSLLLEWEESPRLMRKILHDYSQKTGKRFHGFNEDKFILEVMKDYGLSNIAPFAQKRTRTPFIISQKSNSSIMRGGIVSPHFITLNKNITALSDSYEYVLHLRHPKWRGCIQVLNNQAYHLRYPEKKGEVLFFKNPNITIKWSEEIIESYAKSKDGIYDFIKGKVILSEPSEKKKTRFLIGISSSFIHQERREAIRRTWLQNTPEDVQALFFLGGTTPISEINDTIGLPVPDDYHSLPLKLYAFLQYALDNYEFDWLFKCEDDTYLDINKLESLTSYNADFIGSRKITKRLIPHRGAGYLLSRSLVEKILQWFDHPNPGPENIRLSELINQIDISTIGSKKLSNNHTVFPLPGNDQITAHQCSPRLLYQIHALNDKDKSSTTYLFHSNSQIKHLVFYSNGCLLNLNNEYLGSWELDSHNNLVIFWNNSAHESFTSIGRIFSKNSSFLFPDQGEKVLMKLIDKNSSHTSFSSYLSNPKLKQEKKLTVKLSAGFGNQLFQLATGFAFAKKMGRRFVLLPHMISKTHHHSTDSAINEIIREHFCTDNQLYDDPVILTSRSIEQYTNSKNQDDDLILLDGGWHDKIYFTEYIEEVAWLFRSLSAASPEQNNIGLHLRLGDYLHHQNRFHLASPDYIRNAVLRQLERGAVPHVDVFTNKNSKDTAMGLMNQALKDTSITYQYIPSVSDIDDFIQLSSYDHFIGSSSTFSWWAAFLHRNLSRQHTVCFSKYFLNKKINAQRTRQDYYAYATTGDLFLLEE